MPGIFGFCDVQTRDDSDTRLKKMAGALEHYAWYQTHSFCKDGLGLGRVSIGLMNPEPQPLWNQDHSIAIVLEGELYDYQNQKQNLVARGHVFHLNNAVEFVLRLYEERGKQFTTYLNGAFALAIWDQRTRELILVNDRLGLRPLYYAHTPARFAFASGVRALLADPALSRQVDAVAIAQMLSFEYVLGNRTLLQQVQLLPPASLLTWCDGHLSVRPYWKLRFTENYRLQSRAEFLESLIYHLRRAVARQLPGDLPAGINLSGGYDSRMLLGLLGENSLRVPLRAFTFGSPTCDDVRFARELAAVAKIPHHYFELQPAYLRALGAAGVRLTDGMESCVHMHALANLDAQARQVRVLYTGHLADFLISPELKREWLAPYDDTTAHQFIFDDINVLFRDQDQSKLYTKNFRDQVEAEFDDAFHIVAAESQATMFADWRDNFDILQRCRRFTEQGSELLRSQVVCRTPFCDNDFVEFALTVPPGLRLDRALFKEALVKLFYAFAKVPVDKTGFPMVPCGRDLFLRAEQQARWRLQKLGLTWVRDRAPRDYADYGQWFRGELRDWVAEILLSDRALARGYFNPDFIRNLVAAHFAGAHYTSELGVLLSIELWHQQMIDS
jgi:asparagine synthase (glutamine-hydrolysing)